jgi:hypothetical protein
MSNEMIGVFGTIIAETDNAILLFDGIEEVWLPLSQIEYNPSAKEGTDTTVEIPEWLAYEKGLI